MYLDLDKKVAVVTGGSKGIGKQIAISLASEGASVIILARHEDILINACEEIKQESSNPFISYVVADTTNELSLNALITAINNHSRNVDILVNCAFNPGGHFGQTKHPNINEIAPKSFLSDMKGKVLGYINTIQVVLPYMLRGGKIINIGGLSVRKTGSTMGSIRNSAVTALTKNLADELASKNIQVNCVHPGITVTESLTSESHKATNPNLIGRFIKSEEVASLVTFLASPKAISVNGESISCGGGWAGSIHY